MVNEVVDLLGGRPTVVDMTVGAGGHAEALLDSGVRRLVGVDRDRAAMARAERRLARFGDRFVPAPGPFSEAPVGVVEPGRADGVLFDLGVSSMQLEEAERGFGYRADGPLDMRMDPSNDGPTAADLVNDLPEEELANLLFELGEERQSRRVARAIVRARARRRSRAHPARRTFQALRIAVNREIEELSTSLPWAASVLAPGGRVVVLSYHSLEDRTVKRFVRSEPTLRPLTKSPLRPSAEEMARNPRSRSAKLRAAEKVDPLDSPSHFPGGSADGSTP